MTDPKKIYVRDEYDTEWEITPEDAELWPDVLARYQEGSQLQYPMMQLVAHRGWGWWSCYKSQDEWLRGCEIPVPDHRALYGLGDATDLQLRQLLQQFGGYTVWLEAQLGAMEARRHALKQGYDSAVMVQTAELDGKASEKSKEARVLATSGLLKQTRRMQIEQESLIALARGMLEAYQRAWETTSRCLSSRTAEQQAASGRHA